MLISCPKCHSIYEIPDNLVGKTGQNFRCHACANVWHVMREDALGYTEAEDTTPYIEAIPVSEPPHRNYPANKKEYHIPADHKSGTPTRSSLEIINQEGNPNIRPKIKKQQELTLTSDQGTSFTISASPEYIEEDTSTPRLYDEEDIHISQQDRLLPPQPFKGYRKTWLLLILLVICFLLIFLRRDIVNIYPPAEIWYNKIKLSGLNNPEFLKFSNISLSETTIDNNTMLKITAEIVNTSRYTTRVPSITISDTKTTYNAAAIDKLAGHEKKNFEINFPAPQNNLATTLTLGFKQP